MDWIRALEKEKNNVCVESSTYETPKRQPPNEFLWGKKPECGYPIPTDEAEFAADERRAIQDFDGKPSRLSDAAQSVMDVFNGTIQ
jgi:hypothetical protein